MLKRLIIVLLGIAGFIYLPYLLGRMAYYFANEKLDAKMVLIPYWIWGVFILIVLATIIAIISRIYEYIVNGT